MSTRAETLRALELTNEQIRRLGALPLLTMIEAVELSDRAIVGWLRRSRIHAETVAQALTGLT